MLTRKLHVRGFSRIVARLMAVVFAAQIVMGGFCLLTAEAHEMPQSSMQAQDVQAQCAKSAQADDQRFGGQESGDQSSGDHSGNCYHCDQPDQLSNSPVVSIAPVALLLPGDFGLAAVDPLLSEATGLMTAQMATGPPRSSSLLYTTSQRILI